MIKPIPSRFRYKAQFALLPFLICCIAYLVIHALLRCAGQSPTGIESLYVSAGVVTASLLAGEIYPLLIAQRKNEERIAALEEEILRLKNSSREKN